ncbi:hypothetical protein Ancab_010744 [Ancistrocladus abbreviatus]
MLHKSLRMIIFPVQWIGLKLYDCVCKRRGARMEQLSNSFAVLELDDEDDNQAQSHSSSITSNAEDNGASSSGKTGKKGDNVVQNGNHNEQNLAVPPAGYRLPLVWIDLEMTGLNVEVDRILEIACIVTDGNLTQSVEGPDLVIHQTQECLDRMGEWCQHHHAASGLNQKVLRSTMTEQEAEEQVIEFVKKHVGTYTPLLAGNSVNICQTWQVFSHMSSWMLAVSRLYAFGGIQEIIGRPLQRTKSTGPWMILEKV